MDNCIDSHNFFRLTEKAFKITPEQKNAVYHNFLEIIKNAQRHGNQDIIEHEIAQKMVEFLESFAEERKQEMAYDFTAKTELGEKSPIFRRIG